ncbi:MAG: hypothetical protein WC854_05685 [Bacteroidales bacterium]
MEKEKFKTIDDLIQGIESIVSKNRGSLSDYDVVLLKNCSAKLKELKKLKKRKSDIPKEIITDIISIILRVFSSIAINDIM